MASYLRGWLSAGISSMSSSAPTATEDSTPLDAPTITRISPPPDEDDEGSETETEQDRNDDDDLPPAFPSLYSAQRVRQQPPSAVAATSNPLPKDLLDAQLMPPPPVPSSRLPGASTNRATPGSLAVPPTTTKRPSKKREKVALAPGHSPMDWANLKASGKDMRGVPALMPIQPSVLKQHRTREDAWTAINGKVYNITPYFEFHPGGEKELMRVAGRDGTKLFASTHAWVNADVMLDACLVGLLVPEPAS